MDETFEQELMAQLQESDLSEFNEGVLSKRKVLDWLERQSMSADAKSLIARMIETSIKVGSTVLFIGRKVLSIVISIVKEIPNTTFALVLSAVMASLIASIPIVGGILGSFLAPLLAIFGISMAAISDLSNRQMDKKIELAVAEFNVLRVKDAGV